MSGVGILPLPIGTQAQGSTVFASTDKTKQNKSKRGQTMGGGRKESKSIAYPTVLHQSETDDTKRTLKLTLAQ